MGTQKKRNEVEAATNVVGWPRKCQHYPVVVVAPAEVFILLLECSAFFYWRPTEVLHVLADENARFARDVLLPAVLLHGGRVGRPAPQSGLLAWGPATRRRRAL